MTSYVCDRSNTNNFVLLPITSLLFDERVADMVEENKINFPDSLSRNIYDAGTFKLDQSRLDRILSGYKTGLPPIKVQKTLNGMYKVLNGRHRICAVIINQGNSIPCIPCVTKKQND